MHTVAGYTRAGYTNNRHSDKEITKTIIVLTTASERGKHLEIKPGYESSMQ